MTEIEEVKKYSGWDNVVELSVDKFKIVFSEFIKGKETISKIENLKIIYTHKSLKDYFIVVTNNSYYIGSINMNTNTVTCFLKFDTLEETCKNL